MVSVLGPECRSSLIDSVVRRTLEPYRSVFTPSEISGSAPVGVPPGGSAQRTV